MNFDEGRKMSEPKKREEEEEDKKKGIVNGTILGGLATVGLMIFVVSKMTVSALLIYRDRDVDFDIVKTVTSDQELSTTSFNFKEYDNSLNFAFGVDDLDFDNQNSPYIEYIAYNMEYTSGDELLKKEMDVVPCSKEFILRFLQ